MILLSFSRKVREHAPLLIDEDYLKHKLHEIDTLDFDSAFYRDARKLHGLLNKYSDEEKKDLDLKTKKLEGSAEFSPYREVGDELRGIYETKKPVIFVKRFRNVFIDSASAINPLHMDEYVDFETDMTNHL